MHTGVDMKEKRFLICSIDHEEAEIQIRNLLVQFLDQTFKNHPNFNFKNINIEIEDFDIDTPNTDLSIIITFNDYSYVNALNEVNAESLMMVLENKWRQPFYINGKFESRIVYEWSSTGLIQKNDIYGIEKDIVNKEFENFVLTC